MADVGWITGHSYIVYGPLALCASTVIFEGVPTFPDAGRAWKIAQDLNVNIFHTAPTTIRALRKIGPNEPAKYNFNFKHMTALAVGKDWRKASPQQQEQLAVEFKTLLVRTYSNALTGYKNQKVVYKPFKMNAGDVDVLVRTEVQQPGNKPVQLDYSLEKLDAGWKVYDVSVAGISLVTNYRE